MMQPAMCTPTTQISYVLLATTNIYSATDTYDAGVTCTIKKVNLHVQIRRKTEAEKEDRVQLTPDA